MNQKYHSLNVGLLKLMYSIVQLLRFLSQFLQILFYRSMAENLDILESFGEKINNKVIYSETHKTVE